MHDGQKRLELRRFEFAVKNDLDYYLPEDRKKMTGVEKEKLVQQKTLFVSKKK